MVWKNEGYRHSLASKGIMSVMTIRHQHERKQELIDKKIAKEIKNGLGYREIYHQAKQLEDSFKWDADYKNRVVRIKSDWQKLKENYAWLLENGYLPYHQYYIKQNKEIDEYMKKDSWISVRLMTQNYDLYEKQVEEFTTGRVERMRNIGHYFKELSR